MTDAPPPAPPAPADPSSGPVPPPPGADYPGKTLGIVGLVLVFIFTLLGFILSLVANSQSKQAGYKNTPAKVGIILGAIFFVLGLIAGIIAVVFAFQLLGQCGDLGPGVHVVNGWTITCGA